MRGKFRKNKHIVMFLQTLDNYKYSLPFFKALIINTIKNTTKLYKSQKAKADKTYINNNIASAA